MHALNHTFLVWWGINLLNWWSDILTYKKQDVINTTPSNSLHHCYLCSNKKIPTSLVLYLVKIINQRGAGLLVLVVCQWWWGFQTHYKQFQWLHDEIDIFILSNRRVINLWCVCRYNWFLVVWGQVVPSVDENSFVDTIISTHGQYNYLFLNSFGWITSSFSYFPSKIELLAPPVPSSHPDVISPLPKTTS